MCIRDSRYIGYDAGEVKRYEHSRKYNEADKKYHNRYPLIEEWGWNRDCLLYTSLCCGAAGNKYLEHRHGRI